MLGPIFSGAPLSLILVVLHLVRTLWCCAWDGLLACALMRSDDFAFAFRHKRPLSGLFYEACCVGKQALSFGVLICLSRRFRRGAHRQNRQFVIRGIHNRAQLIDQEPVLDNSIDPYIFTRDAYLMYDENKVNPIQEGEVTDTDDFDDELLDEIDG